MSRTAETQSARRARGEDQRGQVPLPNLYCSGIDRADSKFLSISDFKEQPEG
jgi:hypothetical protein